MLIAQNQHTAKPKHQYNQKRSQELTHRMSQRLTNGHFIGRITQFITASGKAIHHLIFCNKRFNDSIGHEIKVLNQVLQRKLIYSAKDKGVDKLTLMHGWIIAYLYDHRDEDVYQKDIENAFSIARSTVTSILKLMEKKNYITRESVESDARLKKLVLTETGIELHYKIENMITKNETLLDSLLTKEEKKQFLFLINKILSGLENAN